MRKIKVVVLLVRQLQHGLTTNAKVSPNLTVTQIHNIFLIKCFPVSSFRQFVYHILSFSTVEFGIYNSSYPILSSCHCFLIIDSVVLSLFERPNIIQLQPIYSHKTGIPGAIVTRRISAV